MKTVMINGSPKKKLSVSAYLISIVRVLIRGTVVVEQIHNQGDHKRVLEAVKDADTVVFAMPLYVDGIPSHVLAFMQEMEAFCKENNHSLKVYVVSNGGFIEGCQSRPLMLVMENFCRRSNFKWCGGIGIGGGVMLNVLRILVFVYLGIFALNVVYTGAETGNWLATEVLVAFLQQIGIIVLLSLGVFFYCIRMGIAINKGITCGVKFTRILLPAFIFILIADIFFTIVSVFKGGLFRGWLSKK